MLHNSPLLESLLLNPFINPPPLSVCSFFGIDGDACLFDIEVEVGDKSDGGANIVGDDGPSAITEELFSKG